jgi:hypothetical protein
VVGSPELVSGVGKRFVELVLLVSWVVEGAGTLGSGVMLSAVKGVEADVTSRMPPGVGGTATRRRPPAGS